MTFDLWHRKLTSAQLKVRRSQRFAAKVGQELQTFSIAEAAWGCGVTFDLLLVIFIQVIATNQCQRWRKFKCIWVFQTPYFPLQQRSKARLRLLLTGSGVKARSSGQSETGCVQTFGGSSRPSRFHHPQSKTRPNQSQSTETDGKGRSYSQCKTWRVGKKQEYQTRLNNRGRCDQSRV